MTARLPNPFEVSGPPAPHAELTLGTLVGQRYRLERVLGQGGMGVVYAARHLELDQRVALKVLPSAYVRDPESLQRFEREARTACRVRHPNVVSVFDLGRLPSGEPYLVMEYLEGRDLDATMGQGALRVEVIRSVLEGIADALDALHGEGIVHRDVKPANVFFASDSRGRETVKLVDFGLATQSQGSARLTQVGHVIGTAAYLPPESARGELCGPAGDIYSLAAMAFEMVSGGVLPFDGVPMAILLDKVSKPAPSLAERTGRPFPPQLEAAIASGLRRRPEDRPPTARAFVRSVCEALGGVVIASSARPAAGTSEIVRIPDGRHLPTGKMGPRDAAQTGTRDPEPTAEERLPLRRAPWILAASTLLLLSGAGIAWSVFGGGGSTPRAPTEPTTPTEPSAPTAPSTPIAPASEPMPEAAVVPTMPEAEAPRPEITPAAEMPRSTGDRLASERPLVRATPERATPERVTPERVAPERVTAERVTPEERPSAAAETATERTQALLTQAQSAMLHGEIPHARELYHEATLASPRNAAAWRGLGLASERLGLVPEARTAYERYLSIAPEARDAETVRARLEAL